MLSKAIRDLSIRDLLHALNEKLGLECTQIRDIAPSHVVPAASLESKIDSLEARAHDVLRFIPSLRNALRPVNRLPPEILSYIARGVQDKIEVNRGAEAIVPLTHVCRYWRESIISIPENWTMISTCRRNLATASLERAKAAPLQIYLSVGSIQEDSQFLDLLVSYFQNTETLWVTPLWTIEGLLLFSQHPMSNLRSLSISGEYIRGGLDRSIDPFESSAYALRYLKLAKVPLYPSFLNLKTLTELDICDNQCDLHLDTILDFLEENRSLTSARLEILFTKDSLRSSRRPAAIRNQLRYLQISCSRAVDGRALISRIALPKGAELVLNCSYHHGTRVGVKDVLPSISTTHLLNLPSPTFMRYRNHPRAIELHGPNGAASFCSRSDPYTHFIEFPLLPLADIRRFHLEACGADLAHRLSFFPALETFAIEGGTGLFHLSTLLSNPSASPSLKTLAFLDCVLTEEFMEELTQFASDRKNTGSARLHRVVIIHRDGILPDIVSIRWLEEHVPVVDVRVARELPTDL